jgi:hypothetical protein
MFSNRVALVLLMLAGTVVNSVAQTKFLFLVARINNGLLLEDNASHVLLEDYLSNLCLEGGC